MSAHAPEAAAGTIYDIGYRRYEGARLGRGHALRALFAHSLRGAFGLGRGGRARLAPWVLYALVMFPATLQVAVTGISQGESKLLDYDNYFGFVQMLLALFCAAQAPELVSTDQQQRVLPLYFARALRRGDYAAAKLAAMVAALLFVTLSPMVVVFVGRLSVGTDMAAAFRAEGGKILPILGSALLASAVLGSASLGLASLTPRRALASAAILGLFLLTGALAGVLSETLEGGAERYAVLINPLLVVVLSTQALFGTLGQRPEGAPPNAPPPQVLDAWVYLAVAAALVVIGAAVLFTRYRRVRV